ncbi:MAG: hypothetical protein AAGA95_12235, partial [Pseudomonadota bacterium]
MIRPGVVCILVLGLLSAGAIGQDSASNAVPSTRFAWDDASTATLLSENFQIRQLASVVQPAPNIVTGIQEFPNGSVGIFTPENGALWDGHHATPMYTPVDTYAVTTPSDGRYYVGSRVGGLSIFDANTRELIQAFPGGKYSDAQPLNNRVSELHVDRDSNVWVAYEGGGPQTQGFSRYDPDTGKFTHFVVGDTSPSYFSTPLPGGERIDRLSLYTFAESPDFIWAATYPGGVFRISLDDYEVTAYNTANGRLPTDHLSTIHYHAPSDTVFAAARPGTHGPLLFYDEDNDRFRPVDGDVVEVPKDLSVEEVKSRRVYVLHTGPDGLLWQATSLGPVFMRSDGRFVALGDAGRTISTSPYVMTTTSDGTLWYGAYSGAHMIRRLPVSYFPTQVLTKATVLGVDAMPNGDLWVTTERGALVRLHSETQFKSLEELGFTVYTRYPRKQGVPPPSNCQSFSDSLLVNQPRSDYCRSGLRFPAETHAAAPFAGKVVLAASANAALYVVDVEERMIEAIYADSDHPLAQGDPLVPKVHTDAKGRLWIAFLNTGITVVEPDRETITRMRHDRDNLNTLQQPVIWNLMEGYDGSIFAVGTSGASRFVEFDYSWDRLGGSDIHFMFSDRNGRFWYGSPWGLAALEDFRDIPESGDDEAFLRYRLLPSQSFHLGVYDGRDYVWAGTNAGLLRVNVDDLEATAITRGDGLPGADFSTGAAVLGQQIFLGHPKGVIGLDTRGEFETTPRETLRLVDVKIGEDIIRTPELGGTIVLPPERRDLELRFSAMEFFFTDSIVYRYQLSPRDASWRQVGPSGRCLPTPVGPGGVSWRQLISVDNGVGKEELHRGES